MSNALSVYLPRWPIRLAQRRRLRQSSGAANGSAACPRKAETLLLVESVKGVEVVARACERAERAGVRAGMTVAHARSLLRDCRVCVEPHAPDEDGRQLGRLARWAFRFSPVVAPDDPDGLLLNIAGCAHLYGGEAKLAERVGESLRQLGFESRLAVAPTFACAQAVSRCAAERISVVDAGAVREALSPLPVSALRVNAATCEALCEIGVERIGQLLNLPRLELAERFGRELTRRMDQALGEGSDELIEPIRPCEPLDVSHVFDGPVTCIEAVQAACRALLADLVQRLGQQESGVCALTFSFQRIDATTIPVTLRLSSASRDGKHLWTLLRPRLERLHLGYGVEEIRLRAERTERIEHGQTGLWPDVFATARSPHESSWSQLLDHLIERLGLENVMVADPVETYVPEQAYTFCSWSETDGARTNQRQREEPRAHPAARPSRLFDRPEPVRVLTVAPDGPLVWLHWRGRERRVYRCMGPERIALPWWGRVEPCAAPTELFRDYYMVVDLEGDWLWVFRDGASGAWFVHGEWA